MWDSSKKCIFINNEGKIQRMHWHNGVNCKYQEKCLWSWPPRILKSILKTLWVFKLSSNGESS